MPSNSSDRATEGTILLSIDEEPKNENQEDSSRLPLRRIFVGALILLAVVGSLALPSKSTPKKQEFPKDFVWGTATSSYQIEGATTEDGRGVSIWDTYCEEPGKISDASSGAVACDHYHRIEDDIKMMKSLGIRAYRFSVAWPRIYPNGTGTVNAKGIDFYNQIIDLLLDNDIEPWITLYHWDLPQALEDRYGGWLSRDIVEDFGQYARTCFQAFGDRVKNWITLNESWTVAVQGYQDGTKAPGKTKDPTIEVYQVGHYLVLAHARAARIYKEQFARTQKGQIGIANCGDFRYPKTDSLEDSQAAERSMVFQFAWLSDPFFFGDYPREMRERLGGRLPHFTDDERNELIGSVDFLGLNHYSTLYAAAPKDPPTFGGYWADMFVQFSSDPSWRKNYMGWSTNPDGCRELLLWISNRYKDVTIFMTENGTSEDEPDLATALRDEGRREYFEGYLRACREAIDLGVNLAGYFAWSLMDNFEWEYGYTRRFGLCYVDFRTLVRTPKLSAIWYSETIQANGGNIPQKVTA
jgi:beta-galactosidase